MRQFPTIFDFNPDKLIGCNSVDRAMELIDLQRLSDAARGSLAAVGVVPRLESTGSVLWVPESHSRLPDWNRVGRQLDRQSELLASLALLNRLIAIREHFLRRLAIKKQSSSWQSEDFFKLVAMHWTQEAPVQRECMAAFGACRTALPDHHQRFDQSLHLACRHFLSRLVGVRKMLGMTAAESCLLYINAIELLDREVEYPGRLPEAALNAGRQLVCDDQWNVVEGHCRLLFRPACESMIRAIQIAVIISITG